MTVAVILAAWFGTVCVAGSFHVARHAAPEGHCYRAYFAALLAAGGLTLGMGAILATLAGAGP